MKRRTQGFTLIEIIVVILTIGIISAILVNAWIGTTAGARDKARETDTRSWIGAFEAYKGRFGAYPVLPTADGSAGAAYVCLGSFSATGSKCAHYNGSSSQYLDATASAATTAISDLARMNETPTNAGQAIATKFVGPFVWETQVTTGGTVAVTAKFINFFEGPCPSDFTDESANPDTTLAGLFSGLTGVAKACSLTRNVSYTP